MNATVARRNNKVGLVDRTNSMSCLRIRCPEWFQRDDFQDWRQGKGKSSCPATWAPSTRDGEYIDVFMTFECGPVFRAGEWEGSDANTLPPDIYRAIGDLLHKLDLRGGVIWLVPVE